MTLAPQISFRHVDPSAALESRIRTLVARLERFSTHIVHCHVSVEAPHRHHHQGMLYEVHINIAVPGNQLCIHSAHPQARSHENPYLALRDAFRAARRVLEDYERQRREPLSPERTPPLAQS